MHKSCHICGLLQDLGIWAVIDKLQKLIEDLLNVLDLFKVGGDQGHLGNEFLLLGPEALLKIILQLLLLLCQLFLQVSKAFVYVLQLLSVLDAMLL